MDRCDHDPGVEVNEVDAGEGHSAPGIDDDALIQDAVKNIE
jgi:hypothetical protein